MSLEIACVCDRYAVVTSDGLEWNGTDGRIVTEHARKQIQLGPNIVVTAGGYSSEMTELFTICRRAYYGAPHNILEQIPAVKKAFTDYIGPKHFPGFGETILGGVLVAKQPRGFLLLRKRGDYDEQEYFIKPGDGPQVAYLTPTGLVEAVCMMYMREAVLEPMRSGASPAQIIANLRALYHAAAAIEDPPKLNENLHVSILGDVPAGPPCEPDKALVARLNEFVDKTKRVLGGINIEPARAEAPAGAHCNNSITNPQWLSDDSAVALGTTEAVIATLNMTTDGGKVQIWGKALFNVGTAGGLTFKIRKDSVSGTVIDQTPSINVGATSQWNLVLTGEDTSPAASQTYVLTAWMPTGSGNVQYKRMTAANLKK